MTKIFTNLQGGIDINTSKKYQDIIETGKRLFFNFGSKRVPVEEICREAGVSKVTFYKYFKNKDALVKVIRDEIVSTGFENFDQISEMDISYPEKIKLISKWRIEFFSTIPKNFLNELVTLDIVNNEFKMRFLKNIKDGQKKGEIKQNIKPELIWLITEKLSEITKEGKWKELFDDYIEYQDQVRNMLFWGMLK